MKSMRVVGLISLGLSLVAGAQEPAVKPAISRDPLTAEQVAIYRLVLADYSNGSNSPLNVADKTETLDMSEPFFDKQCIKGLDLEPPNSSVLVIHRLDDRVAPGMDKKIVLVDSDQQQKKIDENDPQKLVTKAIDGAERVTEKQVGDAVTRAFETGLFTFSEIIFDKRHRHALLTYSFVCGRLCGHGNMLILKKSGEKWKVIKRCGGWVS